MKLILLTILFTASLHAQNDTAYFDDGSMVIGKGGIKVYIEDGNIVIDGSGITDFVPVDTVARIGLDGDKWGEFVYEISENTAGATKEVLIEKSPYSNGSFKVPNSVSRPDLTPINDRIFGIDVHELICRYSRTKKANPNIGDIVCRGDYDEVFFEGKWHKIVEE